MKTYIGKRNPSIPGGIGGCEVWVEDGFRRNKMRRLAPRLDLYNHSPTGFEWGYGGSGPAQLALAILANCLGDDEEALEHYQRFKFDVIAGLPREGWTLTEYQVREALGLTIQ